MLTLPISVLDRLRLLLRRDERIPSIVHPTTSVEEVDQPLLAPPTPLPTAGSEVKSIVSQVSAEERQLAEAIVRRLAAQIPYAQAVALLPADDRMPLAHAGSSRTNSPASMAMQFGRIAQQASRMAEAVGAQEDAVQELIITSDQQIHLLRALGDASQGWLYLAVDAQDINLAIARSLMQQVLLDSLDSPAGPPAAATS